MDTKKRIVISALPNTLLIHLKRFEFDFDAMKHVKVNDRLEFPDELNMLPYTKEGLSEIEEDQIRIPKRMDTYYQYHLVGIIVHTGTSEGGHYYSFVKERKPLSENSSPKWYRYDDTKVTPFDPAHIPSEAFGGESQTTEYDRATQKTKTVTKLKPYNAYILVYERKVLFDTEREHLQNPKVTPENDTKTKSQLENEQKGTENDEKANETDRTENIDQEDTKLRSSSILDDLEQGEEMDVREGEKEKTKLKNKETNILSQVKLPVPVPQVAPISVYQRIDFLTFFKLF